MRKSIKVKLKNSEKELIEQISSSKTMFMIFLEEIRKRYNNVVKILENEEGAEETLGDIYEIESSSALFFNLTHGEVWEKLKKEIEKYPEFINDFNTLFWAINKFLELQKKAFKETGKITFNNLEETNNKYTKLLQEFNNKKLKECKEKRIKKED